MNESTISVGDSEQLMCLFGPRDQHVRRIRDRFEVGIFAQDEEIHIQGEAEPVRKATEVLEQLKSLVIRQGAVLPDDVTRMLDQVLGNGNLAESPKIEVFEAGRNIQARTSGQADYLKAIATHDLVFCIGPAGTGKTYLAVAMAVSALHRREIHKIVLVRPAVEAGESLGFLPGDLQAKINPYLRPLLDALREMIDYEQFQRLAEQDVIEVIPLAYMRGRTLNEAFIILDEAQNTTVAQMKMFLTRMGMKSKIVVAGDVTQTDLPPNRISGLVDARARLKNIKGFREVVMTRADIVRHGLVQQIVRAYEEPERGRKRR